MTFYENYLRLCNKAGKSPSAVAIEAKVGKPAVSRWKAGTKPRDATITKLAAYFNVPVSELKCEADDPGIKKEPPQTGEAKKADLVQRIRDTDDEDTLYAALDEINRKLQARRK